MPGYSGATTNTLPSRQDLIDSGILGYTPTALNVSKRQIYQDLGNAYKNGKVNDASEQGSKTLVHAIKTTLDIKYPEAVPHNLDSSDLLQLEPYFARAINRISQRDAVGLGEKISLGSLKDPIGLGDVSPSKLGKLVAAVWDRPEIKSKVARMIYSKAPQVAHGVVKNGGQVAAPALRTALEAEMYTAPDPELMLNLMGSFAEFERSLIKGRQMEGIAIKKAAGGYAGKGRPKAITDDQVTTIKARVAAGEKKTKIAADMKISRESIYKLLKA